MLLFYGIIFSKLKCFIDILANTFLQTCGSILSKRNITFPIFSSLRNCQSIDKTSFLHFLLLACPPIFLCTFMYLFVLFRPNQSFSVLNSPFKSLLVPLCPYQSFSVLFHPYQSFSVLTCPFLSLLVCLDPYKSFSVLTCPFRSLLVLFCPYLSLSVLTCPF